MFRPSSRHELKALSDDLTNEVEEQRVYRSFLSHDQVWVQNTCLPKDLVPCH